MNQLTSENETAKQIVSQLLENHQTIVSMISHEIRNPLTLVSSALQIIEIQHSEVINFHGWSQAIEDIEFMCNLLNELSDFNNGSTLHHSVFSLEKLLKNIAVSFAMSLDSINSNIEFTSKISLNSDNYTGDKIKFEEVILNLLQNAKDAVSEKTFTDSKGSIFLCAEKISDSIVISCTDNGCGISDDIVNTIFDPFVTYKTNGTGLGLALSKKIIEAHGGTLIVTSSDETGTVFTITLPV
jgi:two-component system sensor histidine kinase HydH